MELPFLAFLSAKPAHCLSSCNTLNFNNGLFIQNANSNGDGFRPQEGEEVVVWSIYTVDAYWEPS